MIAKLEQVDSLDTPGIELYLTLKSPLAHRQKDVFVAEGSKVVERFLLGKLTALSFLMTIEWFERSRKLIEQRTEPIDVFIADAEILKKIVGFKYHQGIMGVGRVPPPLDIEQVITNVKKPGFIVALDNLEHAENVGVVLRNCGACGVSAVIAGETCIDPWLRRSVRNSMGAIFAVPVIYSKNLAETLTILKRKFAISMYAAHVSEDSVSLYDTKLTSDCCVVFGNEGKGLSQAVIEICDEMVRIPMAPERSRFVDSFNVACASAIVLSEVYRQRRGGG